MKISVIVSVRNNPDICKCIESFEASSYPNKELIIVNDGSQDHTLDVIRRYSHHYIDCRTHVGPAVARNKGAQVAVGQVLFFIDSDAVLYRDTLSQVALFLQAHPQCQGATAVWDKEPLEETFFSHLKAIETNTLFMHYFKNSFGANGQAIYRNTFLKFGGFSSAFKRADAEDFNLGLDLFREHIEIPIVPSIIIRNGFPKTFWQGVVKYFRRAYLRSSALKRFKLGNGNLPAENSHNSKKLILVYVLSFSLVVMTPIFFYLEARYLLLCIILWFYLARHILKAFWKEKGFAFFLRATPIYFLLCAFIGCGGILGHFFLSREGEGGD
ncbi:MAG: glycosyltransferase family 2 protein [Deltaproteobacteria bacterium]|nr:glycosyltransferase family 2 protein [Deltaproteobacteria bacterium]